MVGKFPLFELVYPPVGHVKAVFSVLLANNNRWALFNYRYRENGHTKGEPEFTPPNPIKLQWELTEEVSVSSV
jgi:hypothetical protein